MPTLQEKATLRANRPHLQDSVTRLARTVIPCGPNKYSPPEISKLIKKSFRLLRHKRSQLVISSNIATDRRELQPSFRIAYVGRVRASRTPIRPPNPHA